MTEIVMYTRDQCKYCEMAKVYLRKILGDEFLEENFKEINSDDHKSSENKKKFEDFFSMYPSLRTVPQIVINGKHIGGYEDLIKLSEQDILNWKT